MKHKMSLTVVPFCPEFAYSIWHFYVSDLNVPNWRRWNNGNNMDKREVNSVVGCLAWLHARFLFKRETLSAINFNFIKQKMYRIPLPNTHRRNKKQNHINECQMEKGPSTLLRVLFFDQFFFRVVGLLTYCGLSLIQYTAIECNLHQIAQKNFTKKCLIYTLSCSRRHTHRHTSSDWSWLSLVAVNNDDGNKSEWHENKRTFTPCGARTAHTRAVLYISIIWSFKTFNYNIMGIFHVFKILHI